MLVEYYYKGCHDYLFVHLWYIGSDSFAYNSYKKEMQNTKQRINIFFFFGVTKEWVEPKGNTIAC